MSTTEDTEFSHQWQLVNTPLNEEWSGRTRYAAAMYFHKRGELTADELEVYRICSRLDFEDPLAILNDRQLGQKWIARIQSAPKA